jgi:hypothetical protein
MNLLYLLMLMWPPPHLLMKNSVGVWCRVSATIDAYTRPPRQRATHQGVLLSRTTLGTTCGRSQPRLPVSVS